MKIAACIIFLIAPFSSLAQFYMHAGYSYSNIKSDLIETDGIGMLTVGLGGRIDVNEAGNFFIQPELNYTGRGFKYSDNPDAALVKFYYFTAPVTLVFKPKPFISLEGGLEIGGLFNAIFESRRFNDRIEVADTYSRWDLGTVIGMGLYENQKVNVSLRYYHGLRNLLQYPEFDNFGTITGELNDVKNRTLQIAVRIIIVD